MSRSTGRTPLPGLLAFVAAALLTSCSDGETVAPAIEAAPAEALQGRAAPGRQVVMLDNCDPRTLPPGFCPGRNAGLSLDQLLEQLIRHGHVSSWRFSPDVIHVTGPVEMAVVNVGGREHSFTEVAEFGPGLVPLLNDAMGFEPGAPPVSECVAAGVNFVDPGDHELVSFEPGEERKYMCCLHPWMRAVTR